VGWGELPNSKKNLKGNYTGGVVSNQKPSMGKVWILTGTSIYNKISGEKRKSYFVTFPILQVMPSSFKVAIDEKIWWPFPYLRTEKSCRS